MIIYPEGTATRDPAQWPMVAKTGVARMALGTGIPVIPVAIWGAQEILPYGSKKLHLRPRHTVRMLAGPPVDLSAYAGQPLSRDVLRGRHGRGHGRHHRPAGAAARGDAACLPLRSRRRPPRERGSRQRGRFAERS